VTNLSPSSPSDLISSIPLLCSLPLVTVTGCVAPANLEDSSQTVIDIGLDFLRDGVSSHPYLCSTQ